MTAVSPADLILRNGRIFRVDAMRSWASAVAIAGAQFVAVGDEAAVEAFNGPATEIVDLQGRMAMPGIVDVDTRILAGGQERGGAAVERTPAASDPYATGTQEAAIARSIRMLNAAGVTAFLDTASTSQIMAALKSLDDRDALTAWAGCAMAAADGLPTSRDPWRSRHVKPDFVEIALDGAPDTRTAAFHDPYIGEPIRGPCFRGATTMTLPALVRLLAKCETLGLSMKIRCGGDAAVTQALDAIEIVRGFNRQTLLTHQIASAGYITAADVHRFGELGVVADPSSSAPCYPNPVLERCKLTMGAARAERIWPNRDILLSGALMAVGSGWPAVAKPDPWGGMQGMITRRNPSGASGDAALWPEQALDLESVIEIYTINGARALQLDEITGSIEIGKSADLIVLDRNLFDTPDDEIAGARVLATYFAGRVVHQASGENSRAPAAAGKTAGPRKAVGRPGRGALE